MNRTNALRVVDGLMFFFFLLIVFAVPLVFSSWTRSVFEVNKLLVLRLSTLIFLALWSFKVLFLSSRDNTLESSENYHLFGLTWRRFGLENSILLVLFMTCLTCVFSQNVWLALIGAYDRWEGIFTFVNYFILLLMGIFTLKQKKHFVMLGITLGIVVLFSSLYGIFQSFGTDLMKWSADPTSRVFACINNPVHFCAFLGMLFPVALSFYFLFQRQSSLALAAIRQNFLWLFIRLSSSILLGFLTLFLIKNYFSVLNFSFFIYLSLILSSVFFAHALFYKRLKFFVYILSAFFYLCLVYNFGFLREFFVFSALLFLIFYNVFVLPDGCKFLKRFFFTMVILTLYVQILSFSRATFVGTTVFLPIFLVFIARFYRFSSLFKFFIFFISLLLFFSFLCVFEFFNVFTLFSNSHIIYLSILFLFLFLLYFLMNEKVNWRPFPFLILFIYLFEILRFFSDQWLLSFFLFPTFYFFSIFFKRENAVRGLIFIYFIFLFIYNCQTFHISLFQTIQVLLQLITLYYMFSVSKDSYHFDVSAVFRVLFSIFCVFLFVSFPILWQKLSLFVYEYHFWFVLLSITSFVFIFLYFTKVLFPSFLSYRSLHTLCAICTLIVVYCYVFYPGFSFQKSENNVRQNLFHSRSQTLGSSELNTKNSRLYMWTSVPEWFSDYPLLGSGLDTIKALFPLYRDPVYGIYEGAHNFTPDRLHNEFLNTLVTRGALGFVVYYVVFIGFFYLLLLRALFICSSFWQRLMLLASLSGSGVYLIQVFFNFGVVPTLVLFYILMSIGLATARRVIFYKDAQNN